MRIPLTVALGLGYVALATGLGIAAASAQSVSTRPAYGCFKVTAGKVRLHETSFVSSAIVGVVERGDILIKRHRFCNVVSAACAISTESGTSGFVSKGSVKVTPCPARLSAKTQ